VHPRTRDAVRKHKLTGLFDHPLMRTTEPLSYF